MRRKLITGVIIASILNVYAEKTPEVPLLTPLNSITPSADKYSFYYRGETLKQALTRFAKNLSLQVEFDSEIKPQTLSKKLNGRFSVSQNTELLDILSSQYGFEWFIYSGTLYIVSNTKVSKSIEVSPENMSAVKSNLQQIGLFTDKFGYSELPAENRIIITGPSEYVSMLIKQIRSLKIAPTNQQFAVYHLKYASATDMEFTFNNRRIVIPGIATVLQSMLQRQQLTNYTPRGGHLAEQTLEPIKNQMNDTPSSLSAESSSSSGARGNVTIPIIQADSRLNTIVIRDKAVNLKIYKDLIDLLDVPAPLIQVEVLIVHLDEDKLSQQGISWWSGIGNAKVGFGDMSNVGPGNYLSFYYGKINPGQLLVSNLSDFLLSLKFLESKKLLQAVGRPSLATTDNIPAIINVTENLYLNTPLAVANNQFNSQNNTPINGNFIQAQVTTALQITPHVIFGENNQRDIRLSIVLQDGTISDQLTAAYLPNSTQSDISSQAIIKEGQSLLLAGYTRDVNERENTQVPFLGDIPILGWLFKSTTLKRKRIGTLYLVTPKVIWSGDMVKLKDYIELGNHKFDIKKNYELLPNIVESESSSISSESNSQALTIESASKING